MMFELFFDIFSFIIFIIIPLDVLASVFSNLFVYTKLGRRFESTEHYRIGFSRHAWKIILAFELIIIAVLSLKYVNGDFNIALVNAVFFPFFVAYNYRFFWYMGAPSSLLYNDKGLIVIRSPGMGISGILSFVSWEQADKIVLQDGGRKVWQGTLTKKNGQTRKFSFFKETRKEIEGIFQSRSLPVDVIG